jgi:hypothetical protein
VLKTSKKDKQRYLDMRKAIGTIFSAKTLELLGIMIQLTPENAVDICEKINVPFADIVTKLKKEKLFQVQMSTLEVDKTVNSLIMYMTFTRDTLRDIAKL